MRATLVKLVFGGDRSRLEAFCAAVGDVLPPGTSAVLRGSAVTGVRWKDGAPFDADGPGTSDLGSHAGRAGPAGTVLAATASSCQASTASRSATTTRTSRPRWCRFGRA